MKSNDFDKIAFVYDRLALLAFGKSIVDSQKIFFDRIPSEARILIMGGGSGRILQELFLANPKIKVCYIDASAKMISKAKDRIGNDKRIEFIVGTENDIPDRSFDVIITNFYLDLFKEESLRLVVRKLRNVTRLNSLWIVTDFTDKKLWHRVMLKAMYIFFGVTTGIEASKLPDWNDALQKIGGKKNDSKFFFRNFIEATMFQF
jgi:ubiquinone/menaquinone biosynthesis C-methylase UbiE